MTSMLIDFILLKSESISSDECDIENLDKDTHLYRFWANSDDYDPIEMMLYLIDDLKITTANLSITGESY
jgi:hypothetical protein